MTRSCRSGHSHASELDVLACLQIEALDLLERIISMTETTGETIDQGFADLDAGQADIEAKLDALTAEETKELAFLADLENNRGAGQLAPDQQARLDDLKARQAAVSAALDAARAELAQADGSEPAPAPATQPVGDGNATGAAPVVASDTPIADSMPEPVLADEHGPEGAMTGGPVESVHDAGEEPASNET